MLELFAAAGRGDADALGGVASLISIIAIGPAAAVFLVNQILQNVQLREDKYRYLNEKYTEYLVCSLDHPEFDLEHGVGVDVQAYETSTRCRLFVLYELYTTMMEAAFRAYRHSWTSSRRTQWQGWVHYLDRYMARPDYRSFLSMVLFRADLEDALLQGRELQMRGLSEYDTEFELFLIERYKHFLHQRPESE
jgi:hypothetical protein